LTAKAQRSALAGTPAVSVTAEKKYQTRKRTLTDLAVGFVVLVLSLFVGEQVKTWFSLPIPGNVVGLSILLICFHFRLISPRLIQEASTRLLFVLPALFIPIYVSAIGQGQLWSKLGWVLLPALLIATAGLWVFVGHLSQKLLRGSQPAQNE
jgi:holin-like protein